MVPHSGFDLHSLTQYLKELLTACRSEPKLRALYVYSYSSFCLLHCPSALLPPLFMKSGVLELVTIAWSHVAFVLPGHRQGCFLCVYLLFDSTKYVLNTSMGQALWRIGIIFIMIICIFHHAATAKLLQLCPTLCNPVDSSPPGSPVPGILQARTLERVAISFSNAWKWKVKVKSLSGVRLLATPWTAAYQAPPSMGFARQEYWSGVPLPSPFFIIH